MRTGRDDDESTPVGITVWRAAARSSFPHNNSAFDPNRHEVLSTQPVDGTESGIVVEVLQKGYALDGQLVRPARVVVSR